MGLFHKIKSAASKVKDVAHDVYSAASDKLDEASDKVREEMESTWDKIADASDDAKSVIGDALTHAFALGLDPLVMPVILGYWGTLATQAKGRERGLPMPFRALLQPYFPGNLSDVRYAERINTADGGAVTFGNYIYFPRGVDFDTANDIQWLIHELRHVQQYQNLGGVVPFLHHYVADISKVLVTKGTFHVHDLLPMEKDANDYRDEIWELVHWKARAGQFSVFDAAYYLGRYPDLKMAFGTSVSEARNHWAQYGIQEGRASSAAFDVQHYLQAYEDLKNAFGENYNAAIDHWIRAGKKDGRTGSVTVTSPPIRNVIPMKLIHPSLNVPFRGAGPRSSG